MRILFTGAGGYLGRGMTPPLAAHHELRLMDIVPFDPVTEGEVMVGDVADLETCRRAVSGVDALVIAHMASRQAGAYETPVTPFDANVKGTANLLFAAQQEGIERAVLVSSLGAVLGNELDYYPRDAPLAGKDIYSLTKACQEVVAEHWHRVHGMRIAVLRPNWVMDADTMVSKYGDQITTWTTGLIDRRDIGEAARLALELDDLGFEIFYVAGPAEAASDVDVAYTRRRLGWQPQFDFSDLK